MTRATIRVDTDPSATLLIARDAEAAVRAEEPGAAVMSAVLVPARARPASVRVDGNRVEAAIQAEEVKVIRQDAPEYGGDYVVTPRVYEQYLPTTDRLLRNDVTIKKIPLLRTRNAAGGDTINIGGD